MNPGVLLAIWRGSGWRRGEIGSRLGVIILILMTAVAIINIFNTIYSNRSDSFASTHLIIEILIVLRVWITFTQSRMNPMKKFEDPFL